MSASKVLGVVVVAGVLWGCGSEWGPPVPLAASSQGAELSTPNGRNLNGRNLNGRNLNGSDLSGMLIAVDYANARQGPTLRPLDSVRLVGSSFVGNIGTHVLSGADFVGVRFKGRLGEGGAVELRVDDADQGTGAEHDVWSYAVSFLDKDGQWRSICRGPNDEPLRAIPAAGRWDYRQGVPGAGGAKLDDPSAFTFACEGAAIAKCIHFGYKPWALRPDGRSLAAYHQACTRMVRADFCGDGESHTQDGQWVNVYDAIGVQQDTEPWVPEAEWDVSGSRCFTAVTRAHTEVSCPGRLNRPDCGASAHFQAGTLLMSESPLGAIPPVAP
ncbi:hypothetical protein DRW03_21115 [Corallococcus sp. H22C18031201]|nr:hypothetical protein DRW03_21115 [Corallococcus sp. H22C18031201]